MIRLADAEAEQERWFTNTVRGNEEWTDADHEPEEYGSLAADYDSDTESEEDEESDEESDEDDMDYSYTERSEMPRLSRMPVIGMHKAEAEEMDYDEDMLDDDEDDEGGMYELTRVTSHRPPSLCSDCSDDEDETHPPSPPQPAKQLLMSEKELHAHGYFPTESPIDEDHHHHHGVGVLFDDALPMISSY